MYGEIGYDTGIGNSEAKNSEMNGIMAIVSVPSDDSLVIWKGGKGINNEDQGISVFFTGYVLYLREKNETLSMKLSFEDVRETIGNISNFSRSECMYLKYILLG